MVLCKLLAPLCALAQVPPVFGVLNVCKSPLPVREDACLMAPIAVFEHGRWQPGCFESFSIQMGDPTTVLNPACDELATALCGETFVGVNQNSVIFHSKYATIYSIMFSQYIGYAGECITWTSAPERVWTEEIVCNRPAPLVEVVTDDGTFNPDLLEMRVGRMAELEIRAFLAQFNTMPPLPSDGVSEDLQAKVSTAYMLALNKAFGFDGGTEGMEWFENFRAFLLESGISEEELSSFFDFARFDVPSTELPSAEKIAEITLNYLDNEVIAAAGPDLVIEMSKYESLLAEKTHRFPLNTQRSGAFVQLLMPYPLDPAQEYDASEWQEGPRYSIRYWAVLDISSLQHPDVLWEEAELIAWDAGNTSYKFLGAADGDGDGMVEIFLEGGAHEFRSYDMLAWQNGRYERVVSISGAL